MCTARPLNNLCLRRRLSGWLITSHVNESYVCCLVQYIFCIYTFFSSSKLSCVCIPTFFYVTSSANFACENTSLASHHPCSSKFMNEKFTIYIILRYIICHHHRQTSSAAPDRYYIQNWLHNDGDDNCIINIAWFVRKELSHSTSKACLSRFATAPNPSRVEFFFKRIIRVRLFFLLGANLMLFTPNNTLYSNGERD